MRFLIVLSLVSALSASHAQTTNRVAEPIETTLPVADVQEVRWDDLPLPVQHTFKSHSRGGDVTDVRKANLRGQTVYLGSFNAESSDVRIAVKKDGSLVAGESSPAAELTRAEGSATESTNAVATGDATSATAPVTSTAAGEIRPAPDAIFAAAEARNAGAPAKVTWEQVPAAVQTGFRTQTDSGQVQDITMGTVDGRPVYDITYRDGDQNSQVRVAATGEILSRAIVAESAGAPLASQPVDLDQLPLNVLSTISAATDRAPVVGIEQNVINGQTVYGVTVMQNGQPVQIRVRQDGQVVP